MIESTWSRADLSTTPVQEQTESITTTANRKNAEALWKSMQEILPDIHMQRLAYLLFNCGLKPREIINACPQEFDNLQEIYRLHRDILERVQHSNIFLEEASEHA